MLAFFRDWSATSYDDLQADLDRCWLMLGFIDCSYSAKLLLE